MKNILLPIVILLPFCLPAQQQSSKSKTSDKLYEKGNLVKLRNASGVNTGYLEYSPSFYQNGIVYVTRFKNGPVDPTSGETFQELFYGEFDESGMPTDPQSFSLQINSQVHEGPVSFSRDGNWLYFSRNNLVRGVSVANSKNNVVQKLYEARRGKYDWENVKEMPFNNDQYSCVHPALSPDGKRLFFSSDMPGGYGDSDLYYVEKKGETWSKPINLGADINTTGKEGFPFLHESGTLFFSSDGHGGEGERDLFLINISKSLSGEVENMGAPFNSPNDDLGFVLNENGTRGYFSSDREGGSGKDDIYMFESPQTIIEAEMPSLSAMIIAYDEQTTERLSGANVRIFERSADGFLEGKDLYDVQLLPGENSDDLTMKLIRKNPDALKVPFKTTSGNGEALTEMKPGKNYLVLVSKNGYESAEIIHSTASQTATQTIRVPMKSTSCANLAGMVGVKNFNTKVPNALVRIVNQSTGTEELLRSNAKGEFDFCLPTGQDYVIFAEKEGYTKGEGKISTQGIGAGETLKVTVNLQAAEETIVIEPIKKGTVIVLENIYYDFNQYFIRKGAARELDALAQLMNLYPSMEVELSAYTDARGTDEYNLELSQQRAASAKRYLAQKGIAENRVSTSGKGEQAIRNHCREGVECTDEEHQYNRRTEVKVTRMEEDVKVQYKEGEPVEKGGQ